MKFGPEHVRWRATLSESIGGAWYSGGERVQAVNNDMFYAFGGADLTVEGKLINVKCKKGNVPGFSFDVSATVTISDNYSFTPNWVRETYSNEYAAAVFLQGQGDFPPFLDMAQFDKDPGLNKLPKWFWQDGVVPA